MSDLRIGIVGLDSPHATAFTKLLNSADANERIAGGRVTVAFAGGSPDFESSRCRVEGITKEMREQWGVAIVDSPRAVAEACDLVLLTSADGRVHLSQFKEMLPFKRPTFVDKPVAANLPDARELFRLAHDAQIAVMSASALRFTEAFTQALAAGPAVGGCDVFGPQPLEETQPGWFWYGIYLVELMVAAMGIGCRSVWCQATEAGDVLTAIWGDGRLATAHGLRRGHARFGITLHGEQAATYVDCSTTSRPRYAGLLEAILSTLPLGKAAVSPQETMEVVKIVHAANRSRETAEVITV